MLRPRQSDGAGSLQACDFLQSESTKLARREIECERAIAHALDFLHVMTDRFEHSANLAIAAFDQRNFVPGIVCHFHHPHTGWAGPNALAIVGSNGNSSAELRDRFFS